MIDDTHIPGSTTDTTTGSGESSQSPVGYCQECGRALIPSTLQRINNGVFCLPCAAHRQTVTPGWQPVNAAANAQIPVPNVPGQPNPGLASMLGFIPGVGAMYNAQYGKSALHLIVFVILVTLADNLNNVFFWLVWGWVFYQVFDAFHTARARRDGLPLPNPFGWNDIGERLGFTRTGSSHPQAGTSASAGPDPAFRSQDEPFRAPYAAPAGAAQPRYGYATQPNPATDNPYTAPYATPAAPVPPRPTAATNVPYVPTYTGNPWGQAVAIPPATTGPRRFPIGALWLIGLGVLFLLGNLLPEWRLSGRWLVPMLLAAVAAWSAVRRWEQFRTASLTIGAHPNFPEAMVGPIVLFAVAVLLALQAGQVIALRRSWPALLVVWGSMLLLQRASGTGVTYAHPDNAPVEMAQAAPPPVRSTSGTGSLGL